MAEMMAKLAAAEAEAEKLRSELKESASAPIDDLARQKPAKSKSRIDGKGGRETIFGTSTKPGDAWLKDGMEFLVRDQPSETGELEGMSEEDKNTVNRRLAIGLLGTGVFVGLSQISDESAAPSKPLFFYLVPLLKIRALLTQASALAEDGAWDELSATCRQIAKANDAKGNLLAAAAYLTGRDEERAKQMAFDFLELLEKIDYNKYFESMKGVPVSGAKAAEYSKFSKRAAAAAAAQLDEFLKLMDREQLDAARSQVEAMAPPPPAPPPVAEEVEGDAGEPGSAFSDGYVEE